MIQILKGWLNCVILRLGKNSMSETETYIIRNEINYTLKLKIYYIKYKMYQESE